MPSSTLPLDASKNVLHRSISEPIRTGLTWQQIWQGPDEGLIACWERGREMRAAEERFPDDDAEPAAERASRGELCRLPWDGGIGLDVKDPPIRKRGALQYLAMWQGLRGEDLLIPLDQRIELKCSRTGTLVVFAPALSAAAV